MRRELDYEGEAALGSLDPVSRPVLAIGPEGMAASWNRTSWHLKGDVISTELRVLNSRGERPQAERSC